MKFSPRGKVFQGEEFSLRFGGPDGGDEEIVCLPVFQGPLVLGVDFSRPVGPRPNLTERLGDCVEVSIFEHDSVPNVGNANERSVLKI